MRTLRRLSLAVIGALVAASPLLAHHEWPVDRTKQITVKGTVTAYTWAVRRAELGDERSLRHCRHDGTSQESGGSLNEVARRLRPGRRLSRACGKVHCVRNGRDSQPAV